MDITDFMTWFLSQIVSMFTSIFSTLDSITFMGTSLLKVSLTIIILSVLIPILLTVGKSSIIHSERSGKVKGQREERENREQGWI